MKKSCKVCRKWQRHASWNQEVPNIGKFFVKMEASFRNHLDLPRKFAASFKEQICDIVKLKGPSGRTWRIEVLKSENKLSLKSGWRNFVIANKIDKNDLLIFKHRGNSSFNVLIFDSSGCEKVVSLFKKNEETETESESESETESIFESEAEKTSSESDTSFRVFLPPEKISSDSETSSRATPEQKMRVSNGSEASRYKMKKSKKAHSDRPYLMSWRKLSVAEQKIAYEMVLATQPSSKLFVKFLSPSDVNHHLTIPRLSANEYIGKTSQSISLLLANKKKVFPGRYCYTKNIQYICSGWRGFVRKYKLKVRSLCLFEVKTSDGGIAIVVHVHPRGN
ncbi:B3 domain-containing protein [Rhynchospora pubera]|uniref:B3 domain-containing protein n=1 Tax=Rhynchospora pubera TaxID=906938 RepID=A0AAV8GLV6_9POAL|nr:B3 domain-containing protein [Rhynchospora pubera]